MNGFVFLRILGFLGFWETKSEIFNHGFFAMTIATESD